MSNWEIIPIGELCHAIYDGPHATPKKVESGPIFLGISNLSNGRIDLSITEHLSESDFVRWTKRVTPKEDDIVFSYETRLGEAALVPRGIKCCLGRRMALMRPDLSKVDPQFLLYAYLSPNFQETIQSRTIYGSTVNRIALTEFPSYPIKIPPLSIQKEISSLLGNLDRKIENLRKQNETLERIAQALFKHWFVDFEFPNDEGKPYKSSGGEMVRSELGEIPVGWRVGKLDDFCNIKHGYPFKGEFITTEETDQVLLTPGNFRIGGGFNSSKYKYYSDDNYDKEYILAPGDLIITMTDLSKEGDTLGYPAFVPKHKKNIFLHNQRLGKIIGSQIDLFFLFFLLCRREYRSHILGAASGSTVRHTSPSRIVEYKFIIPTRELLDQFSLISRSLINKGFFHDEKIQSLLKIRDTLLPQFMSGQLHVI
jgi:type I restriction enzyme, S subunit